ncbi:MAG: hypothetical protein LBT53_01425, partial [Puniceicoccales bacterium]|nr:hypothetical protein [Puniceicoccales bacterium]
MEKTVAGGTPVPPPTVVAASPSPTNCEGPCVKRDKPEQAGTPDWHVLFEGQDTSKLMELMTSRFVWESALECVERNNGAPGPDGMRARELRGHLEVHGSTLKA